MRFFASVISLATVGVVVGQGVTDKIAPKAAPPSGCETTFSGLFQVTVATVTTVKGKRDVGHLQKRDSCAADGTLVVGLADGVLKDSKARTGYIASNRQFQFDGPPQAGAIYTAGFSVCANSSLALGGSTVFYQCASGDFYNLYDTNWAPQCSPVEIIALPCGGPDPPYASESPDGQVVGTTVIATTVVIPLSDGQPQVITTSVPIPLCQIGDGQLQAKTTPCASITSVAKPTTAAPVSQYSDGQIQVTPLATGPPPPPAATTTAAVTTPATSAAPPPPVTTAPVTAPVSSVVVSANSSSTLVKTTASTSAVSSASTSAPATTSAPAPANGAANLEISALPALIVGILGAVWFL